MLKRYDKALLTEDYLIRMINMMVAALLQVVGLRQAGSYAEAQIAIDQVIEQVFGLRADLVRRLDDGYLLARLTHQGVLNTDQLLLLADLLREEAGLFGEGNRQADSYWSYLRALNFYLEVVMRGGPFDYPEPHDKIEAVLSQLDRFSLPSDTLASLSTYYEGRGAYARAEAVYSKIAGNGGLSGAGFFGTRGILSTAAGGTRRWSWRAAGWTRPMSSGGFPK